MLFEHVLCVARTFRIEVLSEKSVEIGVVLPGLGGGAGSVGSIYVAKETA